MSLLGLELSDVGIMVAGGNPPQLLEIDRGKRESPGCVLADETGLIVGREAQERARLKPRFFNNHFWDELGTEPLSQPGFEGKNNAELAYIHLSKIWNTVKGQGGEIIMAVPGFFTRKELGLILGIAHELSMPVKGFVPLALAASSAFPADHTLLHVDIHLHRAEVTLLEQNDYLRQRRAETLMGKGVAALYAAWVKAIADEFVRTTRFDPFDQAVYEQEIYDRLPEVLREVHVHPSTPFEMKVGSQRYRVILTNDLFAPKGNEVLGEIRRLIEGMVKNQLISEMPLVLQVTQRISILPHYRDELSRVPAAQLMVAEPGSAALGVLELQNHLSSRPAGKGVTLLSSRPRRSALPVQDANVVSDVQQPTHLLYGNIAYPLSPKPLTIGQGRENEVSIRIPDNRSGISPYHCTIQRKGNEVILTDQSSEGTFIDGMRVSGTVSVRLGQTIELGTSGEQLRLIVCVGSHET